MQGNETVGSPGKPGNRKDTSGIGGKFHSMIPPPLPPHPGHPTMTGTTVCWPSFSVVSQMFSVHAVLVAPSVEASVGAIVSVEVIVSGLTSPADVAEDL